MNIFSTNSVLQQILTRQMSAALQLTSVDNSYNLTAMFGQIKRKNSFPI